MAKLLTSDTQLYRSIMKQQPVGVLTSEKISGRTLCPHLKIILLLCAGRAVCYVWQTNAPVTASESVFSMGGLQEKVDDIQNDLSEDPFKDHSDPFKS